jgi:putative SOS response-associated peptidase YedK
MCSHFDPTIDPMRLGGNFGVYPVPLGLRSTLWPGYHGPFVRKHEFADVGDEAVPERELLVGSFGLIPHWAKDASFAKRTYNARSETAHEKPSFRDAWKHDRHCIIPAEAIYEPDWRSGNSVQARISRADGLPMGIAGLWACWKAPSGETVHSFTMLTINADDHPLMRNYHKPDDEKRMVFAMRLTLRSRLQPLNTSRFSTTGNGSIRPSATGRRLSFWRTGSESNIRKNW